ncbi:uncharacterized protein LOC130748636 [Lotus japonicus]|uniref:uncharacterized protein LOC130748636 n=1 Tax=Lotus japonicus TaxID=34305 RepID=UPI0025851C57|nr:uncharacterized protein LOC130748636 [Lotus japonicus]
MVCNMVDGLNFFYLGGTEFRLIEVQDRGFMNVRYRTPPLRYEFGWGNDEEVPSGYESGPDEHEADNLNGQLIYHESELPISDTYQNKKTLPVALVHGAILPHTPPHCVLRDEHKRRFFL